MEILSPRFVLAAVTASVLAGCATPSPIKAYDGQQLPVGDTATLSVDNKIYVRNVGAYQTGIKVTTPHQTSTGTQFEVLPGRQKIVFDYYSFSATTSTSGVQGKRVTMTTKTSSGFSGWNEITYDFEKGHKYELHYSLGDESFKARIVDVTNGEAKRGSWGTWGQVHLP